MLPVPMHITHLTTQIQPTLSKIDAKQTETSVLFSTCNSGNQPWKGHKGTFSMHTIKTAKKYNTIKPEPLFCTVIALKIKTDPSVHKKFILKNLQFNGSTTNCNCNKQ